MVDFRIDVIVNPTGAIRGARQVEGHLRRVETSADRLRRTLFRAFAFAGVTAGIRQLVELSDTFTSIQNRIKIVTEGQGELALVTERLFAISNGTRTSFQATAEIYSRTALAARDLGLAQSEVLNFTESVNQAVILSGASVQESVNGLIQLSQGLASGALRGDELRSVLEQIPVVADVIAKSLGITRGELRALGAQGKITAQVVTQAFREAREELAERFAEITPTIGQAFVVLRNNFIGLLGEFQANTGLAGSFADVVFLAAQNLETLARVALAAGIALSVDFARRGVVVATRAVVALGAAILTNPIGALATALVLAGSAAVAFSDQITIGGDSTATLADLARAAVPEFAALGNEILNFTKIVATAFANEFLPDIEFSLSGLVRSAARNIDITVKLLSNLPAATRVALRNLPAFLELAFVGAFNFVLLRLEQFANQFIEGINFIREKFGGEALDLLTIDRVEVSNEARETGRAVARALIEGLDEEGPVTSFVNRIFDRTELEAEARELTDIVKRIGRLRAEAALDDTGTDATATQQSLQLQKFIQGLKDQNILLKINNSEREVREALIKATAAANRPLLDGEEKLITSLVEQNRVLEVQNSILDEIRGPQEEFNERQAVLVALFDSGTISADEFNRSLRDLNLNLLDTSTSVSDGFARGFLRAQADIEDFASTSESLIVDAFSNAEDALVKFVQTGKLSFNELFADISEGLIRLGIQQAFAAAFGAGGGGLNIGGLITSGITGFQHGGEFQVSRQNSAGTLPGVDNRLVVFAARDNEHVQVTPAGQKPQAQQRPINLNVNVTMSPGSNPDDVRMAVGRGAAIAARQLQIQSQRNN